MNDFSELSLHDGVLYSISLDWEHQTVLAQLSAFLVRDERAKRCEIHWFGVTNLLVPRHEPWGSSNFINDNGRTGNDFWIEMQSGDRLLVQAERFVFRYKNYHGDKTN